jgi:DNA-binding NarL/FixJ family response regulator
VLAEGEDPAEVAGALRAGARGYLPTTLDRAAATEAIRFVLAGGTFVPAGVIAEGGPGAGRRPGGAAPRLSPRELEVAGRLREGKPNKIIARELSISESTVKVFVRRILAKLGAANRTEAAFLAERCLGTPERDVAGPETIAAE